MPTNRTITSLRHWTVEKAMAVFDACQQLADAVWDAYEPEIGRLAAEQSLVESLVDRDYEACMAQEDSNAIPF